MTRVKALEHKEMRPIGECFRNFSPELNRVLTAFTAFIAFRFGLGVFGGHGSREIFSVSVNNRWRPHSVISSIKP
jgi:hypothetical protein